MNRDTMIGKWQQFKGKVKERWGKLTDNDLDKIEGRRDQLVGKIQETYGIARAEAEKQLKEFESSCECEEAAHRH
jgi:uncharacterized protein YjbJ (UPF0337 family)